MNEANEAEGELRPRSLTEAELTRVLESWEAHGTPWLMASELRRLREAIRWALGEGDEFPTRQPGDGAYWWRKELRRRAGLRPGNAATAAL